MGFRNLQGKLEKEKYLLETVCHLFDLSAFNIKILVITKIINILQKEFDCYFLKTDFKFRSLTSSALPALKS